MSFHLSVKVISIYWKCLYIPAEESMACSSLVAHGLCFLKTVSTLKERSSLWHHHYCRILKTAQLWRKINSNGDYWVHLFQVGKSGWEFELVPVSTVGRTPQSGGGRSAITLQPVPQAHACDELLTLNALYLSVLILLRHEGPLSCWSVMALLLHPYKGFSTEVEYLSICSCCFGLLYNST